MIDLSVCIVAYNQRDFICEALDSVLSQQFEGTMEIIIHDDCSTDGTRELIAEYRDRHPSIRAILSDVNVGPCASYWRCHRSATGRFVAHLDGDDLMLPGKLQSQVDLLRSCPAASMATHRVKTIAKDGTDLPGLLPENEQPLLSDINHLARSYVFFVNSSKTYRREVALGWDSEPEEGVDYFLHLRYASRGPIIFDPNILGAYRKGVGVTSTPQLKPRIVQQTLEAFAEARALGAAPQAVDIGETRFLASAAMAALNGGDLTSFRIYSDRCASIGAGGLAVRAFLVLRHFPPVAAVAWLVLSWVRNCIPRRRSSKIIGVGDPEGAKIRVIR